MYVKCALSYHGGTVFGHAVDNEKELARTILAIMIKCLYGGPQFIHKTLPVSNLNSFFLRKVTEDALKTITDQGGEVLAIIADGHKINQKTFDDLSRGSEKPWKMKDLDTFLLFDFVHILKCVRNNWLTETCREIEYTFRGEKGTARWSDLVHLFDLENTQSDSTIPLVKLSKLNQVSSSPKPIERQNVKTCLRVFSDKIVAALETHPLLDHQAVSGTKNFIQIFCKFLENYECSWSQRREIF